MPKVAIIGNCQAQAIETIFLMYTDWEVVRIPAVFLLTDSSRDEILTKLREADVIFAQRVTDDYPVDYLRTSILKTEFPQVVSWPNIYFSGYFPDIQYIYLQGIGKLVGPLEDYHLRLVHYCYSSGKSIDYCKNIYFSDQFREFYPNPFETSLAEFSYREQDVDLRIGPVLETTIRERKAFFTVNHPTNILLFEMVSKMMRTQGGTFKIPNFHPYALAKINIPIYPDVRHRYGLQHLAEGSFVGIGRMSLSSKLAEAPTKVYEGWQELITAFYRFYDSVYPKGAGE